MIMIAFNIQMSTKLRCHYRQYILVYSAYCMRLHTTGRDRKIVIQIESQFDTLFCQRPIRMLIPTTRSTMHAPTMHAPSHSQNSLSASLCLAWSRAGSWKHKRQKNLFKVSNAAVCFGKIAFFRQTCLFIVHGLVHLLPTSTKYKWK